MTQDLAQECQGRDSLYRGQTKLSYANVEMLISATSEMFATCVSCAD